MYYRGRTIHDLTAEESASSIGFVQQNPDNQIVTDYVWHELAFGLENMALPVQDIRRRVSEMASFFGMEEWFHKKTCQLSGGQKQMLNLAAVMAMDPEVLILDEPTNGLDPLGIEELRELIRSFPCKGITVILSSHILSEVQQIADHVGIIAGGVLGYEGELRAGEDLEQLFMDVIRRNGKEGY